MIRQRRLYDCSPEYGMSMHSLLALSQFQNKQHCPAELEPYLGQSTHWYEQWHLHDVVFTSACIFSILVKQYIPDDENPSCRHTT